MDVALVSPRFSHDEHVEPAKVATALGSHRSWTASSEVTKPKPLNPTTPLEAPSSRQILGCVVHILRCYRLGGGR